MSSDAYHDLWKPFFSLFWRHWPDCPWSLYLGSEQRSFPDGRVTSLNAGNRPWSARLRFCLNHIQADYVLLLLEDYFLDRPVPTSVLKERLANLDALHGCQLRLFPHPGPDAPLSGFPELGIIQPHAAYSVSTQAAFWSRLHLLDLLQDEESIWNFEWNATQRSRQYTATYYSTYKPLIHYRQVVERGEWFRSAARHFGKQPIGCDFTARPIMSRRRAVQRVVITRLRNLTMRLKTRLLSR
jgi:hypothetical protein